MVSYEQLRSLGYSRGAIEHRIAKRRLHRIFARVYAVGRAEIGVLGTWMAAVLACGEGAHLSHESAAELHGFWPAGGGRLRVTIPTGSDRRPQGISVHRRSRLHPPT